MAGQVPTHSGDKIVRHPRFGQGNLYQTGADIWATFEPEFSPLGRKVSVYVDIQNGDVPASTVAIYREIEGQYSKLMPEIITAVCSKITTSAEAIQRGFTLEAIDLRGHLRPCILRYRTDRTDFNYDWYVGVSRDYCVEYCGERD